MSERPKGPKARENEFNRIRSSQKTYNPSSRPAVKELSEKGAKNAVKSVQAGEVARGLGKRMEVDSPKASSGYLNGIARAEKVEKSKGKAARAQLGLANKMDKGPMQRSVAKKLMSGAAKLPAKMPTDRTNPKAAAGKGRVNKGAPKKK
jgi:hypothetical protein